MDPLEPLLLRLDHLSEEFREVREGIHKAIRIADEDPEMALTRSRKVLELVVRELYQRRIKEPPGTRPLENLIQRLVKDGFFPERMDAFATAVRKLGNIGTHTFGERITPADVQQSLSSLMLILEWYFEVERPDAVAGLGTEAMAEDRVDKPIEPQAISGDRSRARKSARIAPLRRGRRWAWLLAGLAVGAVVVVAVWLWPIVVGGNQDPASSGNTGGDKGLLTASIRVLYYPGGEIRAKPDKLGDQVTACNFADGVRVEVELSRPAHAFLLAFDSDSKEKLLWPANEADKGDPLRAPPRTKTIRYPTDRESAYALDDNPTGGLQVFAVVASVEPLPSYQEWHRRRKPLAWRKQPAAEGVWAADPEGAYPMQGGVVDRGGVKKLRGLPPLAGLCRTLATGVEVDVVEALAFPVRAKGDER